MFGVEEEVDIHIGTLSKAVGVHGGFVACRAAVKSFLLNRGRSYIFSTSLTVPVVAAALAAIKLNEQVLHFEGSALQNLNHLHTMAVRLRLRLPTLAWRHCLVVPVRLHEIVGNAPICHCFAQRRVTVGWH